MTTSELLEALGRIAQSFPETDGETRWYLFGSAMRDARLAADYDLAIVCAPDRALAVRCHLKPWSEIWPIHLTILTPAEDEALQFTREQRAIQFHPPEYAG
jgi:predicted nucleotidyltransferase